MSVDCWGCSKVFLCDWRSFNLFCVPHFRISFNFVAMIFMWCAWESRASCCNQHFAFVVLPSASENVYATSLRHERDVVPTFRQLCLLKTFLGCCLWAVFTRLRKKRPSFVLSWTALLTEGVFEIDLTSTTKNAHTRSPSLPPPCKWVVEVMSARVYRKTHAGNKARGEIID